MITLRKLSRQPDKLILRKAVRICRQLELEGHRSPETLIPMHLTYVAGLVDLALPLVEADQRCVRMLAHARNQMPPNDADKFIRTLSDIRYALMEHLGEHAGDWDMIDTAAENSPSRTVLPIRVYLDHVRSPFNVGSVFRTAESFSIAEILLSPGTASADHPRSRRTAMGAVDLVSWREVDEADIETSVPGPYFALEVGGKPLNEFCFPSTGTLIIGSEELGVCGDLMKLARRSRGVVSIPTAGVKASLNLSVAFGIVMEHWYSAILSRLAR